MVFGILILYLHKQNHTYENHFKITNPIILYINKPGTKPTAKHCQAKTFQAENFLQPYGY